MQTGNITAESSVCGKPHRRLPRCNTAGTGTNRLEVVIRHPADGNRRIKHHRPHSVTACNILRSALRYISRALRDPVCNRNSIRVITPDGDKFHSIRKFWLRHGPETVRRGLRHNNNDRRTELCRHLGKCPSRVSGGCDNQRSASVFSKTNRCRQCLKFLE